MLNKIKNKKIFLVIIFIIIILLCVNMLSGNKIIKNIYSSITGKALVENSETQVSYIAYDNQNSEDIRGLVVIENEIGIEYVIKPDGTRINGNGKNKIIIDYNGKLNETRNVIVKKVGENEKEYPVQITQEGINKQVQIVIINPIINENNEISGEIQPIYIMENSTDKFYYDYGSTLNPSIPYNNTIELTNKNGTLSLKKEDKAGNILITESTYSLSNVSFITYGDITWTNGKANIDIIKDTTVAQKIECSINNENWEQLDASTTLTGLSHGDIVMSRIVNADGEPETSIAKNIKDEKNPKIVAVNITSEDLLEINSDVNATLIVEDEESGVYYDTKKSSESKYLFHKDKVIANESEATYTGQLSGKITGENITAYIGVGGVYYLHIMVKDVAGNITYGVSDSAVTLYKGIYNTTQIYNSINNYIGKTVINSNPEGRREWYILKATQDNIYIIPKTVTEVIKPTSVTSGHAAWKQYLDNENNWKRYAESTNGGVSAVGAPYSSEAKNLYDKNYSFNAGATGATYFFFRDLGYSSTSGGNMSFGYSHIWLGKISSWERIDRIVWSSAGNNYGFSAGVLPVVCLDTNTKFVDCEDGNLYLAI